MSEIQLTAPTESHQWLQQRHRYEVLSHLYRKTHADCANSHAASALNEELTCVCEDVPRILRDLEYLGYLAFTDAGLRVRLTPRALSYLLLDSGRRRSIRSHVPD